MDPIRRIDPSDPTAESQRRRALASAHVGSWSRHLVTGVAQVDLAWCQSLSLDPCAGPDHLERWARRIHPDDASQFLRAHAELAASGPSRPEFELEYRILTLDSRWLWVLQRGGVTRAAADGRALEAAGICIEIDARKRAEVEAHENEQRLATALWGARAAFWQIHRPSDTAIRSPYWYAMTGYSREAWEEQPQPWLSRIHPDDRQQVERLLDEHLEGRSQYLELRYRLRCANGAWKWIMDRGRVVEWDFEGQPVALIGVSIDIDEQKRAELALRSTEARLETAIWGAGAGLYELDCTTGATRWLNDWCSRFDIDPCDGPEHVDRWDQNIHPDDLPAARARFSGHLAGSEEYYDAEYRIRTRSGRWRWIFERGRVIERDAAGAALRLVGTCMDIDQRKRAERAAQQSEHRLRLALEGARGCLWEWDVEKQVFNDAYYLLHGVDPAEGRRDPDFWRHRSHPDDLARICDADRAVVEGRLESYNAEYRVMHADGRWCWMVDRFRGEARDENGRARRLVGFAVDITAEVEAREALRTQAALLSVMREAVLLIGRDYRVRLSNPAFDALLGAAPGSLLGRDVRAQMLAAIGDLRGLTASVQAELDRGDRDKHVAREFDWRKPDGQVLRLIGTFTPVQLDGLDGLLAVYVDVTQERRLERQIVEAAAREQRRLSSDLHDGLGQELTGVALMLRSIAGGLVEGARPAQVQLDEIIGLVNHAIESARVLARGLAPVSSEQGGLPGALRTLADSLSATRGLTVRFSNALAGPCRLSDEAATHLFRIAQEAVANALHHAQATEVCIALAETAGELQLEIRDNGKGFPEGGGASPGMGIQTMHFRAEVLRGTLEINSGNGVTVRCRVPVDSLA
jgi:PAS domain S-box-containing protein